jgi:hypothetical protein
LDIVHAALDFLWLITTIAIIYLGIDSHQALAAANKETTVSKSMILVGGAFFLLAGYHIYEDLDGVTIPVILHLVPLLVLSYAIYEYRRLMREA